MDTTSTRTSRHVKAPRATVYRALLDPVAIASWKVPTGMTCSVHTFDARESGLFRISLTYDGPTGTGKTTSHTDIYHGTFMKLTPNEQVVEMMEFETVDVNMRGQMMVTITLTDAGQGTDVLAIHDNVPPGVSPEDNAAGWKEALDKLAAYVEAGPSRRLAGHDLHLAAQMEALWAIMDENHVLARVLDAAAGLMPPNWYLGAGCIAQTVWNYLCERDLMAGIHDLDLVYFDATDLSEETEDAYIQRVRKQLGDLSIHMDVKNEARVHVWYEKHFGYPVKPYSSLEDAINSWPTTATSIGIRRTRHESVVYAPYGLNDLFAMVVRPNKKQITRDRYEEKVRRWRESWPSLQIIPW